jgi:phospholipid/cholesterol/gamma-HCH transport system ATP-binding protein
LNASVITVANVVTRLGRNLIHDNISLRIGPGEIYGLLGGSGSGKSTLMKEMVMLLSPQKGEITVLGHQLSTINRVDASLLQRQWGVLFQAGALYSSLTVAENIGISLKEYTDLSVSLIDDIVALKINMVGLPAQAAALYPAELSGGMVKRASLARALAMDPQLLFLDEPTSGLDPIGAEAFDELILKLRSLLGLTVIMVTHDLDSIWNVVDRFALLGDHKVIAEGTLAEVRKNPHPIVRDFFGGARARIRSSGTVTK